MNLSFQLRSVVLIGLMCFCYVCPCMSQKCVLVDAKTGEPVMHASLYSRDSGKFKAAISGIDGTAVVNFPYKRLTVSHINYEQQTITHLRDTLRLMPKAYMTSEVVVQEIEPEWIRRKLKDIVKQKEEHYYNRDMLLNYDYSTQNIGTNTYYRYRSEGVLRMKNPHEELYNIHQLNGQITANDSTKLTDMFNLRRMLYEDFVTELDNSFIRTHRFAVNDEYKGNPGEVELAYRSRKGKDDHGRIVIDTVQNVVLSASRVSGTESNKDRRTSDFMLSLSRLLTGYVIQVWNVDYRVRYTQTRGSWHPLEIRYKFYFKEKESRPDKSEQEYHKETGGGFSNMESTLNILPMTNLPDEFLWKTLPKSWYLKFNSDEERAQEIELAHMPAEFVFF
ncbi:MAG: hypothetical protein K5893_10985 [Prevotella sp.]|nr:hypothetical protein [Prevotella sp.]